MIDFKKRDYENEREYLWRVGSAIEKGIAGIGWEEATKIINKELHDNEEDYKVSASYRKPVQSAFAFYNDVFLKMFSDSDNGRIIQEQLYEMQKTKKQISDQRREYNKLIAREARSEHLMEELVRAANNLNNEQPLCFIERNYEKGKEVVVCFSDFHYGMVAENIWNKYNTDICKQRIKNVVDKMTDILKEHTPDKLHVLLLGDFAHGGIHVSARVAAEENICDQLMNVSDLLAQSINQLSSFANKTYIYSAFGNHMRTIQNKDDNIYADNMEKIIPWWMKQRFKGRKDIGFFESIYEFIYLNVLGYGICGIHGDLDEVKDNMKLYTLFNKVLNVGLDYIISAHRHHNESFETMGVESIAVGSLCSTDEYANKKRLYSKPSQTVMVFTKEDGELCRYNVKAEDS